jgi:hypothetical protein
MDRPWNARQFDRVGAVIAMDQNGYPRSNFCHRDCQFDASASESTVRLVGRRLRVGYS